MKMIEKFLFILFLISTGNAMAEWTYIGATPGIDIYFDKSTLLSNGSVLKLWSKWEYLGNKKLESGITYRSYVQLATVDCSSRTIEPISIAFYDEKEKQVMSVDIQKGKGIPMQVPPDTAGAKFLSAVCPIQ